MRLRDRVAIVTGGGRGIGRGTALRLATEGAAVMVCDIIGPSAEETAEMIRQAGGRAIATTTDVSVRTQVAEMMATTLAEFGRLDILVNNAGLLGKTPLLEITDEVWDRFMAVNLKGPFLCSQAAAAHWIEKGLPGSIVNVGSVESTAAFPDQAPYAASKGGVLMLTKSLALDLGRFGIRVNAVGPGTVDSRGQFADDPERAARYKTMYPLGRIGRPLDIANAILFLASDEADWITGEILYVDGGYLTH